MSSDIMQGQLAIRVDADMERGTGHVMRCLALAQAWQDSGGRATFMMVPGTRSLEERLLSEGMRAAYSTAHPGSPDDARQLAVLARSAGAQWVVVDGYHFGGSYQKALKDAGFNLLAIDDNGHAGPYHSDIVLNQNLHAKEGLYKNRAPYTRLLLGTTYSLLRREFWKWRAWTRETPRVARNVLITLGGTDKAGMTERVIESLKDVGTEQMRAEIVVGKGNLRLREIKTALESLSTPGLVHWNVTDMATIMSRADVAISASGTTSWELAFMGVPMIAIVLAENQAPIAKSLEAKGVAINAGWHSDITPGALAVKMRDLLQSPETRRRMCERGKALVDGHGATRVVEEITSYGSEVQGRS